MCKEETRRVLHDLKWHLHIAKLAERLRRHSSGQLAVTPPRHRQLGSNSQLHPECVWEWTATSYRPGQRIFVVFANPDLDSFQNKSVRKSRKQSSSAGQKIMNRQQVLTQELRRVVVLPLPPLPSALFLTILLSTSTFASFYLRPWPRTAHRSSSSP